MSSIGSQLEKCFRVRQQLDALARREPSFTMLNFGGFLTATFADFFFLVAYLRYHVRHETHVGLKAGRGGIDSSF